ESIQIRLRGGLVASQEVEQFGWNTAHSVTSRGIHSGERRHHLTSLTVSDTRKKRTQITTQVVGHMTEHYIHIPWIPLFFWILFFLQNLESIQIRLRGGLVASQEGEQFGWNTAHSVTSRGIHSGER
ncbi:hypothetical protein GBF38_000165, partial [Nibea albiflora]